LQSLVVDKGDEFVCVSHYLVVHSIAILRRVLAIEVSCQYEFRWFFGVPGSILNGGSYLLSVGCIDTSSESWR
jgi:hypothetical protein